MDVLWDFDELASGAGDTGARVPSGGASADEDADDGDDATTAPEGSDADASGGADGDLLPELALVETHVPREEVLARIERVTEALLRALSEDPPHVPPLELQRANGAAVTRKRLLSSREGPSVVRLWRVLAECHANLSAQRSATQRELYYALADGVTVRRAAEVNAAIQDAVSLLGVPRACLGVTCASRGAVAGVLSIKEDNAWVDLAATQRGHAIPGDMAWIANAALRSDAAFILVVEKDAVFNRLLQERACERLHAVMMTARGQPDLASRAMLARLAALRPVAPVLGLVDWNPSGVLILTTYKLGALRSMGLEAGHYTVNVSWLAARAADLAHKLDTELLPLTPRDDVLIRNMLAAPRFGAAGAAIAGELRAMAARRCKAELEALYNADADSSLTDVLLPKILRGDYV